MINPELLRADKKRPLITINRSIKINRKIISARIFNPSSGSVLKNNNNDKTDVKKRDVMESNINLVNKQLYNIMYAP